MPKMLKTIKNAKNEAFEAHLFSIYFRFRQKLRKKGRDTGMSFLLKKKEAKKKKTYFCSCYSIFTKTCKCKPHFCSF